MIGEIFNNNKANYQSNYSDSIDVKESDSEKVSANELINKVEMATTIQLEKARVEANIELSVNGVKYTSEKDMSQESGEQESSTSDTVPETSEPTETPKEKCESCGGTGICPECGGGTYACKRCGGATILSCSFCDGSGNMPCGCGGKLTTTTADGEPIPEDGWRPCDKCGGDGWQTCEHCGGGGKTNCFCKGTDHEGKIGEDCILCHGGKKCTACGGTGEK